MLLMAFGTSELGRAIYSYNTLDKTVRDAARHLSQHGPGDTTIATEAKCLAVFGKTDCTGTAVAPGLTIAMITVCDATLCPSTHKNQPTSLGAINLVTASVNGYAYNSLVEFIVPDMTFNNIAATLRAQL